MSEVLPADRSRLLRSKQAESSRIVTSRKRKLREFFAVCDNSEPIPTLDLADIDVQPTNDAEKEFLDACDISQNRLFDEAKLPARRNLRSNSSKQQSPSRIVSPEPRTLDPSRKVTKSKGKDASKKSRATSPVSKVDEQLKTGLTNSKDIEEGSVNGTPMQRSSSKGSQTDLPPKSAAVVDEIVKETFENEAEKQPSPADTPIPTGVLESVKIATRVESPPGSPGVDPSKTAPVSMDEAGQLPEPLVDGQLTSDSHHQAATIHLPPKEVQEERLGDLKSDKTAQEQKEQPGKLSINLPSRDGGRGADALSSPGSTSHSATTPAYHEASTDTSPDNENHQYEADRLDDKDDKDENPETPSEMRPIPEEISEKEEHDRVSEAQLDPSDAVELLRSSPAAVDAQIRSEEQAAVNSTEAAQDAQMQDAAAAQADESAGLTKEAGDVVEDIVEDVEEVVTVPTAPEDPAPVPQINEKKLEVADSEDGQTPVDNMDVDVTTVKDSFETNPSTGSAPALSPAAHSMEVTEKSAETPQEPPAPSPAPPTPQRTPSASAVQPPPLERMTTRVASGAIKHKSVSEIIGERVLGESPRPNTGSSSERSTTTKGPTDSASAPPGSSPSRSATPATPGRARGVAERTKERERSKLSTVVFPKKPRKAKSDDLVVRVNGNWELPSGSDDYFLPMHQARPDVKTIQPTEQLLSTAHKTVTTSNMFLPHMEGQIVRVLGRIKELQAQHKWSLRQPKRSREPNRPGSHWDVLLQEMKWMRTDFREERKWKMVVAKNLATDCAEWKEAGPEDQKLLQVNAKSPSLPPKKTITDGVLETIVVNSENSEDAEMADVASSQAHPTPDLVASGMDSDSVMEDLDEEPRLDLLQTVAPTAIFGLQDDDVVFGLRRSPGSDKLLEELPMYSAPLTVPTGRPSLEEGDFDPDAAWRLPILPLSKYVEGRIELKNNGPPQKTSRFDYEDESDDEDLETFGQPPTKRVKLTPEMTCVALFNPEYRHIRDRIHAGHQFRPPTEFPMPNQSFFECRTASQWTPAEDDELKTLVREYTYNWSLISSVLTSKSMYSSGAERRTPWECFERWISLEGLPSDMQKTHYFKQYNNRMELAQRALLEQAAMQPPQPNANGVVTPARRRHTTSISVPRRRNQKHLTLVDAMRKQAKKRETTAQKQQHAASLAAMRKANEVPQPRAPAHTPQDFSRLKHEREVQMQERLHRYQQQQDAVRRQAMAARNPQMPQPGGAPQQVNRGPMPPNGPNGPNGQPIPIPNPNQLAVPGQNRPRMPMAPNPMAQPMQNGLQVPQMPQMPMSGVPQAQMQAIGRLPVPNPQLDINQISQARRIAEQQRQAVQMQQQGQQHPGQPNQTHNSPPNMRQANMNMPQQPYPNMMPPFSQNPHAVSTPPPNGQGVHTPGSAGSPRMGYPVPQMLPHGGNTQNHSTMEAQIRQKFPNITQDQVTTMIRENVKQMQSNHQRQLSQSAMAAAAGGGNMNGGNGNGNGNGGHQTVPNGLQSNPQMYAQMLREQQRIQQQQALQAPGNGSPVQQQQQPQPQSQSQPQQQNQQNQQNQQPQQQQQVPRSGSAGSNGGNGALSIGVSGNGQSGNGANGNVGK